MKSTASIEWTIRFKNMATAWCLAACVLVGCKSTADIAVSDRASESSAVPQDASRQADAEPAAWHDFQQKAAAWRTQPAKPVLAESVRAERLLAENALHEKRFESAADHYETGLGLNPLWPEGHFNVALLYAELKDYYQAIWHMRAYLELVPDSPDAQASRDQIIIWQDKLRQPVAQSSSQIWIDPENHLMWPKQDNGQPISWHEADTYCNSLSLGGLTGWRLPTLAELEALYDPAQGRDGRYRIKGGIQLTGHGYGGVSLFGRDGGWLWSSNVTRSPEEAWYFSFSNGARYSDRLDLSVPMRVLCVRHAQRMF